MDPIQSGAAQEIIVKIDNEHNIKIRDRLFLLIIIYLKPKLALEPYINLEIKLHRTLQ